RARHAAGERSDFKQDFRRRTRLVRYAALAGLPRSEYVFLTASQNQEKPWRRLAEDTSCCRKTSWRTPPMSNATLFGRSQTRRQVIKSAALGSAAAFAAPYVKDAYAAGTLSLGCWDHWVPGANNALTKLCNEWGAKNNVEVKIDYITSQGEKDKLTAAAEAQAGTGHDIMSHRDWNIRVHGELLEPLDDIAAALIKQYGPISPVAEYLAKIKSPWRDRP